ncbi:MAG: DinB family protein [Phycisphaerales bacterium]|nr:DinB family protein [Phycisphaerales bacterium]
MTIADPAEVMIAHDRWANRLMYECCEGLSVDQFNQRFEMGVGSLHDNLVHNLGAMRGWTDVLDEVEGRPRLEAERMSITEMRELHDEVTADFERAVYRQPFETLIHREGGDQSYTFTVGGILSHVMTHSMHHRAQCLNMLRQLGVEELPQSSVMEWMLSGEMQ